MAVVIGLIPQASAADKIFLSCDGFTASNVKEHSSLLTGKQSFTVDADAGRVNSSLGNFRIIKIDDREIKFEGPYMPGGVPSGTHEGRIDRVTGEAVTWITGRNQTEPWLTFILTCNAVTPKF